LLIAHTVIDQEAALDIAAWLRRLGLERYEQAFRHHAVDLDVLSELSEADLAELGVALGHRQKLLEAIAELAALDQAAAGVDGPPPDGIGSGAERRQLTVMLCDLVGPTEFSATLDPEVIGEFMLTYHRRCTDVLAHWGGHVAKLMGGGVLAYFGWPRAHEDDAERAVRAALALVAAVRGLTTPAGDKLAVRVGIATGIVVVGDLVRDGAAQEEIVVGETPNLAARLRDLAPSGAVVVAPSTRRLVGGLFELTDLGPIWLKGFAEPVSAFRVEGEGRAEGRFEALRGGRLTPLVGREPELAILLKRWALAKEGAGQVVLVSGEPGIGKSRLIRALREELSAEPHVALSQSCSRHRANSSFYPIITHLERSAGFAADDVPEVRLAKLETLLSQATDRLDEAVPLVGALLGIPTAERYPGLSLSPQRQKQRTLEVLSEQLVGLARDRPVLVLCKDVHWIDPSTLELLDRLVERVRSLPVLVVITYRPEFNPPWTGHPHVSALSLNRLGRRESAAIVRHITAGKALPAGVLEQIVSSTDGVPLFVEELTKMVLEAGLLTDAGDRYDLVGPLPALAIPATLRDSLTARLDHLAPIKEVAQIGAVIGRDFSHELLAAASSLSSDQLTHALEQLVSSELVFRRGIHPAVTYSFKHALIQDAAYQSLLRSRRQQLHARIARVLEERFPETAESQPEFLAYHCTQAGLAEKAVGYLYEAGHRALGRSAMVEAVAHLTQALDLLTDLGDSSWHAQWEVKLRAALGRALAAAHGTGAPETGQNFARALELCDQTGDRSLLLPTLYGLIRYHFSRAELTPALELAERALGAARRGDDGATRLAAHFAFGWVSLPLGLLDAARTHLEEALAVSGRTGHESLRSAYGVDLRVMSLVYLSWTLFILGYIDQAQKLSRQALAEAKSSAHPLTLCVAFDRATAVADFCREITTATAQVDEMLALGREQGFLVYVAKGDFLRGRMLVEQGRPAEGIAPMGAALATLEANRDEDFVPLYLVQLATAHARAGQAAEGLSLVRRGLTRIEKTGERLFEAELHRLEGEILESSPIRDDAAALKCFRRAIAAAQEQGAKSWELRAATSLARLWRDQGRRAEARDLLAPVYGWFTEGFDTADLRDAKALLDELG
jgi:class 3 adenylate cyclase/predicted ATPase